MSRSNTIRAPSGEKEASPSKLGLSGVRLTGFDPSAFITQTSPSESDRSLSKTIRFPSGEKRGTSSPPPVVDGVMSTGFEPSAFITKMCAVKPAPGSTSRAKAIFLPSGENVGL